MSDHDWPQWLRDAHTENARVEISSAGLVIWCGGVWRGGIWCGGEWRGGVWCGGIWRGGIWHDGEWCGGEWCGGDDNPTRCMFSVRGSGDTIKIECMTYTLSEARALCDSGDLPSEAPARDSEAGRLLRAAVLAQIRWQEALND